MGGENFEQLEWGKTAEGAFNRAVIKAQYNYGHAGYTGTIAEKIGFTVIPLPEHKAPLDLAREMMSKSDERIDDKWGPAGCIEIPKELEEELAKAEGLRGKKPEEKLYLFFGWASS